MILSTFIWVGKLGFHQILVIAHYLKKYSALAGVAQWNEYWPENQRVTSSIPSQGTCLGCMPGPQ